jgi:iron complex outermembrane recepter protein
MVSGDSNHLGVGLCTALGRWSVAAVIAGTAPVRADVVTAQLADLSLEQLRDVVVVTVSRFEERLDRAAASAYVITADDIRRSGATTIPEALRLAPTLDVARADANQYAISARGFDNVLANKMLVLIDGRTVYTPLFSGVFWEAQDVMLEDVERIEVVSGPSTALWGSNAVNGLIHIITRKAADTHGPGVSLNAGDRQRGAAVRQGLRLGEGALRVYAKSYDRDDTHRANGTSVQDRANGTQVGFRADWALATQRITVQGDAYHGSIDQVPSARRFSGANLVARWERTYATGATLTVQGYVDHTERDHPQTFHERLDTVDVVAEYGFRPVPGHHLLLGAGYRHADDRVTQFAALGFDPPSRGLAWTRLFVQDQFALAKPLTVTLATSLERNPYTGTEVLPSARLAWQIDEGRMAWAALSRAVRAPSRVDREFVQPANPPFLIAGGPDFRSEVSGVLELGYRAQSSRALSYSATLFHHEHRRLRSLAPTPQGLQFRNDIEGWTRGIEAWMRWRVAERWRLDAGVVARQERLRVRQDGVDAGGLAALGNDPRHWSSLRSSLDLSPRIAWDIGIRYVGARPQPLVPSYTAVDSRLAWRFAPDTELALVIQNVLDPRHAEWGVATNRVELERSAMLQLRWRL